MSVSLVIVLAACTGTATPQLAAMVSGIAADSAALSGVVSLKDASPATKEVAAKTDASGSFAVNVSGLTPPFLLRTEATDATGTTALYALSDGGAVNINPITDAVVAGAGGGIDPGVLYAQPDPAVLRSTGARAGTISAELSAALAPLLQQYGVTDPVADTSPQAAEAIRAMLADVRIDVAAGSVVVTNRQTDGVIYDGPSTAPSTGTFLASNLPAATSPPPPVTSPPPGALGALGAFPGCQGSGCSTRGGFTTGGAQPAIYRVTSLADGAGPGTLGQCIAAAGPRVCVFAVSGTIRTSGYAVVNPYLTIDGRTAPGGGIQLSGEGTSPGLAEHDLLWIRTHDVVVRGLRLRAGWQDIQAHSLGLYAAGPSDDLHHVVLDHNSFAFGKDGNVDIYGGNSAGGALPARVPREMTLSYNVIAEDLDKSDLETGSGSRGNLTGGGNSTYADQMVNIDYHHNYFANNMYRNPLFTGKSGRWVNNVIFNWRWWGMELTCGANVDVVGNLGKLGPSYTRAGFIGVYADDFGSSDCASGTTQTYLSGNQYAGGTEQGWGTSILSADSTATAPQYQRGSPLTAPTTGPAIAVEAAGGLTSSVVAPLGAGASHRLDCGGRRVANRDSADVRVAETQWASLPSYSWSGLTTIAGFGGYPVITPAVPAGTVCAAGSRDNSSCTCADTDGDGIPDYWEAAFCSTATGCDPLAATVSPPWTNLEAFLSGMVEAP